MASNSENVWRVIELTHDHKPSEEKEKKRVIEFGGRIEA
jgi:hypothetical protein